MKKEIHFYHHEHLDGETLPIENLDRNNFASWEIKMHQYLVGQGNWSYIKEYNLKQNGRQFLSMGVSGELSNVLFGDMCP